MNPDDKPSIKREDFVRKFMGRCGMSYLDAVRAYETMVSTIEDGIVGGHKICIGKVGSLTPVWHEPRDVKMGFTKTVGGGIRKEKKVFHLDGRFKFRFNLYRKFVESRDLRWVMDEDAYPSSGS